MIWLWTALLSLTVAAAMLWPLWRGRQDSQDRRALELDSHRRQLGEIDAELAAGRLADEDADTLRLEVQRRMLRTPKTSTTAAGSIVSRPVVLSVIAVLLGGSLALYITRGNPSLPDAPAPPRPVSQEAKQGFTQAQEILLKDPTNSQAWIEMTASMAEMGKSQEATEALAFATSRMPDRIDLWVARGIALVEHGGGQVSPAAKLAFQRASQLDPSHPGPRLFLALAWMQAGEPDEAKPILEQLKKDSPADAPWMPRVERMLNGIAAMTAAGVGSETPPR
jgi:cytochrome c-type biogenesis protein CcmH